MKFSVCSKKAVEETYFGFPHVLISITDPMDHNAILPENPNRIAVQRFKFHDADIYLGKPDIRDAAKPTENGGIILFNRDNAEDIISFILKYVDNIDNCVIHCHGGVSRSPSIACALQRIFNYWEPPLRTWVPNKYIYDMILRTYYDKY